MEYKAVYRCRLCGKEYQTGATAGEVIANACMYELAAGLSGTVPMAPRKIEPHCCPDGSLGVADFLGWKAEKSPALDYDMDSESGLFAED